MERPGLQGVKLGAGVPIDTASHCWLYGSIFKTAESLLFFAGIIRPHSSACEVHTSKKTIGADRFELQAKGIPHRRVSLKFIKGTVSRDGDGHLVVWMDGELLGDEHRIVFKPTVVSWFLTFSFTFFTDILNRLPLWMFSEKPSQNVCNIAGNLLAKCFGCQRVLATL